MAAASGVEGDVDGVVVAEVALDAEGDLLNVRRDVVEVGGKAGGKDCERESGGEVVLIDEEGV